MINQTSLLSKTFRYGVIMGLGFCLYTTLMWLTKLDTDYLSVGQYFDIAIIAWPITMIFLAIRDAGKSQRITLFQRVFLALITGIVSYLIYEPFLYTYHHYINPEWFNSVLQLKEYELLSKETPRDVIAQTLDKMKATQQANDGLFTLTTLIPSVVILPTIIGLLSALFIRNKTH